MSGEDVVAVHALWLPFTPDMSGPSRANLLEATVRRSGIRGAVHSPHFGEAKDAAALVAPSPRCRPSRPNRTRVAPSSLCPDGPVRLPAPTMTTPEFAIRWLLRVVLTGHFGPMSK